MTGIAGTMLAGLMLAAAIGAPEASSPPGMFVQESENAVLDDARAILTLSCGERAVAMRLRWPARIETPALAIGVGSSSGMDGMMGPPEPWRTLDLPDRQIVIPPTSAAAIVRSAGNEDRLLLMTRKGQDTTTAEFDAHRLKEAFERLTDECHLPPAARGRRSSRPRAG